MPRAGSVTNRALLNKLTSMETSIDSMLDDMNQMMRYQEMRSVARTRNAVLYNSHQNIELLSTDNGGLPMNYPTRAIDIVNIPDVEVVGLLQSYDLNAGGDDYSQRKRLAEFLGVMLP
ncbi:hypothetical protein C1645_757313 [Glomus cerebriforme]|uniref:Uncharacterized protein n=1 Tax=Glomus cerebriforme TaxID=658196 RepID=A0A397TGR4_9GLOM|nr:hypothetical protein C1645_757313 [Glomus cerebriforme]